MITSHTSVVGTFPEVHDFVIKYYSCETCVSVCIDISVINKFVQLQYEVKTINVCENVMQYTVFNDIVQQTKTDHAQHLYFMTNKTISRFLHILKN